jgi:transcriptional regulator with XRE-family HTH domain
MLVGGCSLELIATEMQRRWGCRPREAHRHAHGWSQDEVAARFTEVAERIGGDRSSGRPPPPAAPMIGTRIGEYERWPNGGRRPSPYVLTVLATVLGTTVERLLDYDDHRHLPDQERTVLAAVLAASSPAVPPGAGRQEQSRPAAAPARALRAVPTPTDDESGGRSTGRSTGGRSGGGTGGGPTGRSAVRSADTATADVGDGPADTTAATRPPDDQAVGRASRDAPASPDLSPTVLLPQRVPRPVPPPLPETPLIAVALDPAALDQASAARRHRRDRLLSAPPTSLQSEEEVIMNAAGQSAEFGEWAEATNVGPTTLEQLEEDVRRLSHGYLSSPPLPVMLATLRIRNRVFTLIEGHQHPHQTRQLYLLAGRLCGLLSWMSGDVGRHAEAETQARTGWLCAELSDDGGLRAWIRATQSKTAFWDGRIRESAQLAEDGLRYSSTDAAGVLLASLNARAWARIGDRDAAHAALHVAQERREQAGEDEVGGLWGFSEAQQSYLAGTTHLYLHEPVDALAAAERAVTLFDEGEPAQRFYGAETIALIDAATAHLQAGDIEGTQEKLARVLAVPPEQRLETFTVRLGELRDVLRRSRHALSKPAAEIQRDIEDFRSGALGQYLSR